jgi:hypothetical protein
MTYSSYVSISYSLECSVFAPQMMMAVGTKLVPLTLHLLLCIGFHGHGLLARFVA